jgi:hypothetical protein
VAPLACVAIQPNPEAEPRSSCSQCLPHGWSSPTRSREVGAQRCVTYHGEPEHLRRDRRYATVCKHQRARWSLRGLRYRAWIRAAPLSGLGLGFDTHKTSRTGFADD